MPLKLLTQSQNIGVFHRIIKINGFDSCTAI